MSKRTNVIQATIILIVSAILTFSVLQHTTPVPQNKSESVWPSHTVITLNIDDIEFVDGDTIKYQRRSIRFLGCDTPEKKNSLFDGDQEPYATRATDYTRTAIQNAETVTLQLATSGDRYGRLLGHIFIDGESLSVLLVEEALAYETISLYGDNGFPDLSEDITEAAEDEEYDFQNPYNWRREHRR